MEVNPAPDVSRAELDFDYRWPRPVAIYGMNSKIHSLIGDIEAVNDANLDMGREERCGCPEVIFGSGKTLEQLVTISRAFIARGQNVLATRLDPGTGEALHQEMGCGSYNELGRSYLHFENTPKTRSGLVGVVTAGTADLPVAEEALCTLAFQGVPSLRIPDVGVAGIGRVLARCDDLRRCDVLIVAAGMEGALPSVIGGLVACPVIAVPTSVGYGASLGGIAALLGMLNSCASGVTVVNIDNGFGAACAAGRIIGS
ncbi:MAG: NCAIR mutase (PurE)-related protein [Rhodothermales bacterium]